MESQKKKKVRFFNPIVFYVINFTWYICNVSIRSIPLKGTFLLETKYWEYELLYTNISADKSNSMI